MSRDFVSYDAKTLTEHNLRVLALLDHGPQSSLDEARAERDLDDTPCVDQPPRSARVPRLAGAVGSTRVRQQRDLPEAA